MSIYSSEHMTKTHTRKRHTHIYVSQCVVLRSIVLSRRVGCGRGASHRVQLLHDLLLGERLAWRRRRHLLPSLPSRLLLRRLLHLHLLRRLVLGDRSVQQRVVVILRSLLRLLALTRAANPKGRDLGLAKLSLGRG